MNWGTVFGVAFLICLGVVLTNCCTSHKPKKEKGTIEKMFENMENGVYECERFCTPDGQCVVGCRPMQEVSPEEVL